MIAYKMLSTQLNHNNKLVEDVELREDAELKDVELKDAELREDALVENKYLLNMY
jgi:hypothetical protein